LRCILLTPLEIDMPNLDRDKYRKVAEPTQADFIRGIADSATKTNKAGLIYMAATLLLSKAMRRGK
jgi:hypothetical protein